MLSLLIPSKKQKVSNDVQPPNVEGQQRLPLHCGPVEANFPEEILLTIFDFLTIRGRLTAGHVCRRWRRLSLVGLEEFAVGSKDLECLDRHLPMTNHFISENEMKRLQVLNLVLTKCGHSLRKLKLSGLEVVKCVHRDDLLDKPPGFYELFNEIVTLLVQQCRKLKILVFDFRCRFSEKTFHFILHHVGSQLTELYFCDRDVLSSFSYDLVMKYLNPDRVQKLAVGFPCERDEKQRKFILRFRHLTSLAGNDCLKDFDLFANSTTKVTDLSFEYLPGISSQKPFLSKLRTFRISSMVMYNKLPCQVPDWISHLQCLEVLSLPVSRGWMVQMLVERLPKLKEIGLELDIIKSEENESIFAQFSKMKNLRVLRLLWEQNYFNQVNFQKACSVPQVNFVEMLFRYTRDRHDLTPFLTNLSRIFPNLHLLDIHGHDFRQETLLAELNRLPKLKKLALATSVTNDEFAQKELRPFCEQKNIQLLWDNDDMYVLSKNRRKPVFRGWNRLHIAWRLW